MCLLLFLSPLTSLSLVSNQSTVAIEKKKEKKDEHDGDAKEDEEKEPEAAPVVAPTPEKAPIIWST